MPEATARSFSSKLRSLTAGLRSLDRDLKAGASPTGNALREFRQTLDNVRMTAWTVSELLNARQTQKNPQTVISFLTAERLRRFSQMVKDLCSDLEHDGSSWPAQGVKALEDSLTLLRERLRKLATQRDQASSQKSRAE
jgi:hypothetical protein